MRTSGNATAVGSQAPALRPDALAPDHTSVTDGSSPVESRLSLDRAPAAEASGPPLPLAPASDSTSSFDWIQAAGAHALQRGSEKDKHSDGLPAHIAGPDSRAESGETGNTSLVSPLRLGSFTAVSYMEVQGRLIGCYIYGNPSPDVFENLSGDDRFEKLHSIIDAIKEEGDRVSYLRPVTDRWISDLEKVILWEENLLRLSGWHVSTTKPNGGAIELPCREDQVHRVMHTHIDPLTGKRYVLRWTHHGNDRHEHTFSFGNADGTIFHQKIIFNSDLSIASARKPLSIEQQYVELGLEQCPLTEVSDFHGGAVLSEPRKLGAGKFNTVSGVTYGCADGSEITVAFKPLKNGGMVRAMELGIDRSRPRVANRNLATCEVARLLGFKVVPGICMGICRDQLGMVMSHAPGKPAKKCLEDFGNPNVLREVTKLQLLDHLTGQIDRHSKNYFVHVLPDGSAIVTGIDLDNSFSPLIDDPDQIAFKPGHPLQSHFRGVLMPQVIDRDMADSILNFDDGASTLPILLQPAEIQAMQSRVQKLRSHVRDLEAQGRIIDAGSWGEPSTLALLGAADSYAGRERARVAHW